MRSSTGWGMAVVVVMASGTASGVFARPAWAQERAVWFPEAFAFGPVIARPEEVDLGGALIWANRDNTGEFEGTNLEGIVVVGHRLPVVRFPRADGASPEVVLGFELAAFSRFALEVGQRDLINSDFRVGAPLTIRHKQWDVLIELLHVSSHVGDDFLARFPRANVQVGRNSFELLVGRRFADVLRLYAGTDLNMWSSDAVEGIAYRWGAEWDEGLGAESRPIWPYAAVHFETSNLTDRVAGTGVLGSAFRVTRMLFRLELQGHFGPSPMGQFRTIDEDYLGLNLTGYF
ncbi:MAG: DUF1207 domain-containing protein [Gemmatimonadota bacterium]